MEGAVWSGGDETQETVDQSSGFCKSNFIFYSKRSPVPLPPNQFLEVTTYVSSLPHCGDTAFVDASTGRRISFSGLWRAVDSVAACLCDFRVRKGNVVLILSPNSVFFPVVCLAVMSLGAIITTANPLNTPREIAEQIDNSSPVLAFTTRRLVSKLAAASKSNLAVVILDEELVEHKQESETVGRDATEEERVERTSGVRIIGRLEEMMRTEPSGVRVKDRVK